MDKDKLFNFYEKMYFKEMDETNFLLSRLPMLLTGVALIFNVYILLFKMEFFNHLHIVFNLLVIIVILFPVLKLLYSIYQSFKAQSYQHIMNLSGLEQYRLDSVNDEKKLERWNEDNPNDLVKEVRSDDAIWNHVINDLIKTTDANFITNQKRRFWLNKAIFWLWINLCLCITIPILLIIITSGYSYVRKEVVQCPNNTEAKTHTTTNNGRYCEKE
ncbi:hypothetical protein B9T13_02810 [Wohlfahrtiimonas chitiniclastica]|uniref:hypothetical protein n=1 Tax=Wohlfahrtiimonas chitiniclastica TaxID=400946 RepID=UPI000B994FE7|nr:hypothetical protein [Wohlfahrtiimonas chitiniclastica]OYQ71617.1 hypothetical protein B9T13_02810 [Wohlfahrtiimonas chitiniclastica]